MTGSGGSQKEGQREKERVFIGTSRARFVSLGKAVLQGGRECPGCGIGSLRGHGAADTSLPKGPRDTGQTVIALSLLVRWHVDFTPIRSHFRRVELKDMVRGESNGRF